MHCNTNDQRMSGKNRRMHTINDQWMSGKNCPSVMIAGEECAVGANRYLYWRFWNTVQGWQKNAYNEFKHGFLVNDALASCVKVWVYINEISKDQ